MIGAATSHNAAAADEENVGSQNRQNTTPADGEREGGLQQSYRQWDFRVLNRRVDCPPNIDCPLNIKHLRHSKNVSTVLWRNSG